MQRVTEVEEGMVDGKRLLLEHVERRAADVPVSEPLDEHVLIDESAASGVDKQRVVVHRRGRVAVDKASGLRREAHPPDRCYGVLISVSTEIDTLRNTERPCEGPFNGSKALIG